MICRWIQRHSIHVAPVALRASHACCGSTTRGPKNSSRIRGATDGSPATSFAVSIRSGRASSAVASRLPPHPGPPPREREHRIPRRDKSRRSGLPKARRRMGGARLCPKDQPQQDRGRGRPESIQRTPACDDSAAGASPTAALRPLERTPPLCFGPRETSDGLNAVSNRRICKRSCMN